MTRLTLSLPCLALALGLAQAARASEGMLIGAAEDAARSPSIVHAMAKMDLARLAGLDAVRVTTTWKPGHRGPTAHELLVLQNVTAAADLNGIRVILSVYHAGSRTTPRRPAARANFAAYAAALARELPSVRHFIIGNEPNLNGFWMPQFNRDGTSASPGAYLGLLAATYDALKAVSPDIQVIGGAVSPRGADNPASKRHTHSPTRFITELGRVYRQSRRSRPVMDAFAFHPYGDHSSQPPEFQRHKLSTWIGLSEYGRLATLLGKAFDGTAQPGSTLPIIYDEFGVETRVPSRKKRIYFGREHKTTRPVGELTQGNFYRRAIEIAYCQPTVEGILLFHVSDEPPLGRWQSGLFYADDTPKLSFEMVRATIDLIRRTVGSDQQLAQPDGKVEPALDCQAIALRTKVVAQKYADRVAARAARARTRR
jgi:Cellulase (glycosyl hydrolase family 5)